MTTITCRLGGLQATADDYFCFVHTSAEELFFRRFLIKALSL